MTRLATAVFLVVVGTALPASAQTETPGTASGVDITLQTAYKKELAFLLGQQRQLEQRLTTLDTQHSEQRDRLQREIGALENRLLSVDARIQEARATLQEVERSADSSTEDQQLIRATLEQAATTLKDYDRAVEVPDSDEALGESAVEVFGAAAQALAYLSTVRREDNEEFFLADGEKTQGTVVHVGRVAAYGVSDAGAGALAPAGGGKLKVWDEDASSVARALAAGEQPDSLQIFLYESLDEAVEQDTGESVLEHVSAGGAIAWVIVLLGVLGLMLAASRAVILALCAGSTERLERTLGPSAREGAVERVIDQAAAARGSAARVTGSVFRSIRDGTDRLDEAISEGLIAEGRRTQLFGTAILVIAAVSPLLGLLGTVTGMISTFDVITKFGTGDPKMLSGGISTALITTELGLIVAIPTLLLGNLLKGWADRIEAEAERAAIRMVTLYSGQPIENGSSPSGASRQVAFPAAIAGTE